MALYDESGGIENTGIRRQVIKEITDFAKKYDEKNFFTSYFFTSYFITDFAKKYDVKKFFSSDQGKR